MPARDRGQRRELGRPGDEVPWAIVYYKAPDGAVPALAGVTVYSGSHVSSADGSLTGSVSSQRLSRSAMLAPGPGAASAGEVADLLFHGVQQFPAGLLAAPARLGADPAVLVHPGMLLACVAAALADGHAGL